MHRCSCQGHQPTDLLRLEISIFFSPFYSSPLILCTMVYFFQCYCYTQIKKTSSTLSSFSYTGSLQSSCASLADLYIPYLVMHCTFYWLTFILPYFVIIHCAFYCTLTYSVNFKILSLHFSDRTQESIFSVSVLLCCSQLCPLDSSVHMCTL